MLCKQATFLQSLSMPNHTFWFFCDFKTTDILHPPLPAFFKNVQNYVRWAKLYSAPMPFTEQSSLEQCQSFGTISFLTAKDAPVQHFELFVSYLKSGD